MSVNITLRKIYTFAATFLVAGGAAYANNTHGNHIDRFDSFFELRKEFTEDRDFRVAAILRRSPILVLAIHGGNIEPGTSELADLIAGGEHSLYKFESLLPEEPAWDHHVPSTLFDEPRALEMLERASTSVSVHGFYWFGNPIENERATVILGGQNSLLRDKIAARLEDFAERTMPSLHILPWEEARKFAGMHPRNIVNRTAQQGVQIELSRSLRKIFMDHPELAKSFARSVRLAIDAHRKSGFCKELFNETF